MEGVVINYRRGKRTMHPNQMILEFPDEPHPGSLIGKKVYWESPGGKRLYGVITALHGRKGAVRARFVKGLPGQAIGDKVYLVGGKEPTKKTKPVQKQEKKPVKEEPKKKPESKKSEKSKPEKVEKKSKKETKPEKKSERKSTTKKSKSKEKPSK